MITADTALRLAEEAATVGADVRLVAPTILKSQVVAALYRQVSAGTLDRKSAERRLDHLRRLKVRYLSDRVSLGVAWDIAARLDWDDTVAAEYLAVTRLQADALVTLDPALAEAAAGVVAVASYDRLLGV